MRLRAGMSGLPPLRVTSSRNCRHAWTLVNVVDADAVTCLCARGAMGPPQPAASAAAAAAARSALIGQSCPGWNTGPSPGALQPGGLRPLAASGLTLARIEQ